MLVLRVAHELAGWGLENMCRRNPARWNTPPAILQQKRGLGLRPGKAELARIAGSAPSRVVFSQGPQPLGYVRFAEPFDFRRYAADDGVEPLRAHELNRACAVFSNDGDEAESTPCRDMESPCPLVQYHLVVREQTP